MEPNTTLTSTSYRTTLSDTTLRSSPASAQSTKNDAKFFVQPTISMRKPSSGRNLVVKPTEDAVSDTSNIFHRTKSAKSLKATLPAAEHFVELNNLRRYPSFIATQASADSTAGDRSVADEIDEATNIEVTDRLYELIEQRKARFSHTATHVKDSIDGYVVRHVADQQAITNAQLLLEQQKITIEEKDAVIQQLKDALQQEETAKQGVITELGSANSKIDSLTAEVAGIPALQQQVERLTEELRALKDEYSETVHSLKKDHTQAADTARIEHEDLTRQLANAKSAAEVYMRDATAARELVTLAKSEAARLMQQIREMYDNHAREVDDWRKRCESGTKFETALKQLELERQENAQTIANLQSRILEEEGRSAALANRIEQLTITHRQQLQELSEQLKLEKETQASTAEKLTLEANNKQLQAELMAATQKLKQVEQTLQNSNGELPKLVEQLQENLRSKGDLEAKISLLQQDVLEQKFQASIRLQQLDQCQDQLKETSQRLRDVEVQRDKALADLELQRERVMQQEVAAVKTAQEQQQMMAKLEVDLNRAKAELLELQEQAAGQRVKVRELTMSIEKAKLEETEKFAEMEAKMNRLTTDNKQTAELNQLLENERGSNQQLKRALEENQRARAALEEVVKRYRYAGQQKQHLFERSEQISRMVKSVTEMFTGAITAYENRLQLLTDQTEKLKQVVLTYRADSLLIRNLQPLQQQQEETDSMLEDLKRDEEVSLLRDLRVLADEYRAMADPSVSSASMIPDAIDEDMSHRLRNRSRGTMLPHEWQQSLRNPEFPPPKRTGSAEKVSSPGFKSSPGATPPRPLSHVGPLKKGYLADATPSISATELRDGPAEYGGWPTSKYTTPPSAAYYY